MWKRRKWKAQYANLIVLAKDNVGKENAFAIPVLVGHFVKVGGLIE
jgi:hypothetical protein